MLKYPDLVPDLIRQANQSSSPVRLKKLVKEEAALVTQDLERLAETSWDQVSNLLQSFLVSRSSLPQTKLTTTPPFQEAFGSLELQKILAESLAPVLAIFKKTLVRLVEAEGLDRVELEKILVIGAPTEPKEALVGFQLWRLAELAELRIAGYRIERVKKRFDPEKEFTQKAKIGLLFRWGPMQMVMVAESTKTPDLTVLLSNDYLVKDNRVLVSSALFYDHDGRLTLAKFTTPVVIDYVILHPSSPDYLKIEATGVPMQASYWAKELIEAKGSKLVYPELLSGSRIPFPSQLNFKVREVPKVQEERRNWVKEKLSGFLVKHRLRAVFVKPAAGSKGGGARGFPKVAVEGRSLKQVVDFVTGVMEERGDVLVQELVELTPLEKLVDWGDLKKIFGRAVQPDRLDWVIRCVATRDENDQVSNICCFIVANDRGVANVGQGGVTLPTELLLSPLDLQVLNELTQIFAKQVENEAEKRSRLKKAKDGRTNHLPGYLITEWLYDRNGRLVFLEGGIGIGICRSYQHYLTAVKKVRNLKASDYWFGPIFQHFHSRFGGDQR